MIFHQEYDSKYQLTIISNIILQKSFHLKLNIKLNIEGRQMMKNLKKMGIVQ